jgi:hypothetical protein
MGEAFAFELLLWFCGAGFEALAVTQRHVSLEAEELLHALGLQDGARALAADLRGVN